MLKKLVLTAALVAAVPALANATWYVASSVSGSGTITSADVAQGAGAVALPDTTASEVFTVTPSSNYVISAVRVNGAAITATTVGATSSTYTISKSATLQNVVAYLAPANAANVTGHVYIGSVSNHTTGGGALIPAGTLTTGSDYTVKIVPNAGYVLSDLVVDGVDQNSGSFDHWTFSTITAAHTIDAYFTFVPTVNASVGVSGMLMTGKTITLSGFATTNDTGFASYSFTVKDAGGNAQTVVQNNATDKVAYFTPTKAGAYTVYFVANTTNGGANTAATANFSILAGADYTYNNCVSCHGSRDAQVVSDFTTSPHWTNLRNNGDLSVVGDGKGGCATEKCHFRSVATNTNACVTCHSDGLAKNVGPTGPTGVLSNYSTSGMGNALPTQNNTCFICHQGSHHGTPTAEYQKSSHYLNPYGEGVVKCFDCHNPHSTTATFPAYDANTFAQTAAGACSKCHNRTPGKPYGIFSSNGTMMQPHTASKTATGNTNSHFAVAGASYTNRSVYYNISSSYVTAGTTCTDCHGHNNQINGEYADTMHADPYGRWKGKQMFKFAGYSAADATTYTPATVTNDGCVRCHTSTGFRRFADSNFQDLRAWGFANTSDKTTELISCNTCHVTGKGAITGEAEVGLPEGNVNGWNASSIRAYNKPYTAFYNISVAQTGRFYTSAAMRDFKESNVCVPCHSGRNGATNGDAIKQLAGFTSFTTLAATGNVVPGAPHGVYQAAVLNGKIGYTFSTYSAQGNSHATIGAGNGVVDTGSTLGPCVSCHMPAVADGKNANTTHLRHSFEIRNSNGTVPTICSSCHSNTFGTADLDAAKTNFQAAASALGEILANASMNKYNAQVVVYNPAINDGHGGSAPGYQLAGTVWTGSKYVHASSRLVPQSLTNAQNAELAGAVYNLNLVYGLAYGSTDVGAYAHNPQYLKQLVYDTINHVRNTATTASVEDAISQIPTAAASGTAGFSAAQVTAATTALNNPNNHYATGTYKVQYMVGSATCSTCHNPAEDDMQAAARVAWSQSGHGDTGASPWMPGSSHLWRSAGDTSDFSTTIPAQDCQRCHTADGYAQFVGSNFTNVTPVDTKANAKVNSPLDCQTCHTNNVFDRRQVNAVSTFYNISTVDNVTGATVKARIAGVYPNVGESNICISCHSARVSGSALVAAVNNGLSLNNSGFQNSHYMGAAGLMYVKAGFTAFTSASASAGSMSYGQSLTAETDTTVDVNGNAAAGKLTSTHRKLGTTAINGDGHNKTFFVAGNLDSNGPCVTCHMKGYTIADTDRPGAGHSLDIDTNAYNQVCSNCHTSEAGTPLTADTFSSAFLEPNSEVFQNALTLATTELLKNYNIKYDSSKYPYFYDLTADATGKTSVTDWTRGGALSNASALKLEGACFNINLLSREPGAFAHARTYTRRLVYDTVDFLDDGVVNQSVGATAVNSGLTDAAGKLIYVKGPVAYDGAAPYAGGKLDAGTSESMAYIINWTSTGAWASPERP